MAGGMPRTVDHVQGQRADRHNVAIVQPAIGFENPAIDAIFAALCAQLIDPETVIFMRPFDWQSQFIGQYPGFPAMVDMAVGDEDFFKLHPRLRHRGFQLVQIAAGVNQRGLIRRRAPKKRAILLQRGDRNHRRL